MNVNVGVDGWLMGPDRVRKNPLDEIRKEKPDPFGYVVLHGNTKSEGYLNSEYILYLYDPKKKEEGLFVRKCITFFM